MVKAYLRYEQARAFGVVASPEAPPVYDDTGKHLVTAALERLTLAVARAAEAADPDELGAATPALDWCSMRHETQHTRLFRS